MIDTATVDPQRGARLLYDSVHAGEALSLSRAEVMRLVRRGQLRAVRVGRLVRIPQTALIEYISQLERDGAA